MSELQIVLYRRLSKEKLEGKQHGFDVQEYDIEKYLSSLKDYKVVGEFGEFYSGRGAHTERKQLMKALALCKETGARLVVTKPDRLSRHVESGAHLINNYDIVFTNFPEADTFMKNMLLSLAQRESDIISERTTAALSVAKKNGVKIGAASDKYNKTQRDNLNKRTSHKAKAFAEQYRSRIELMCSMGLTYAEMAVKMKELKLKTARDFWYSPCSIRNLCILLGIDKNNFKLGGGS